MSTFTRAANKSGGAPEVVLATVGDVYLNGVTGDVYEATDRFQWKHLFVTEHKTITKSASCSCRSQSSRRFRRFPA